MAKPNGISVARTAAALLNRATIPYVAGGETLAGMDCQGLVEYCVRASGGSMSFAGSNDMFRNACTWVGTLAEAKAQGKLVPGAALFILEQDGGEPAKYKADGLGNASHIGLYTDTGEMGPEVMHASASKGCVCASTLKNAWTHVGLLTTVDYGGVETVAETGGWVTTVAESGDTVNARKTPSTKADLVVRIPLGATLPVLARSGGWTKVLYGTYTGWVLDDFLWHEESGGGPETPSVNVDKLRQAYALLDKLRQAYALLGEVLGEVGG